MTEKLYYADAYLKTFDAAVLELTEWHGKPAAVLDRTAFFPEGGGQPGDIGTIGSAQVTDTQIREDIIYHVLDKSPDFNVGDNVVCSLNWAKRFARMQAHSGEHIVSGIAHSVYGANNVGFHMDDTLMTVDFDLPLTKEDLTLIERKANACVYENVPIYAWYPNTQALAALNYRSKTDILADVRIVTIKGYDDCACCAVHVKNSGEVGIIKILTAISHRGGTRLTLICGVSAYEDYASKHRQTLRIADLLAAKHGETDIAVEKQLQKEKQLKYEMQQRTSKWLGYVKDNTAYTDGNLELFLPEMTPEDLKTAAVTFSDKCRGLCVVLSGDDCKGYYFAMSSQTVKVVDFTKCVTAALKGSGGGRYDVVQGRLNASADEIKEYFNNFSVNQNENA